MIKSSMFKHYRFWKPRANQNVFTDHDRLPIDEDSVDVDSLPNQPTTTRLKVDVPDILTQQTRDRLLHLVLKIVTIKMAVPTFPSAKFLDILLKVGITKRLESDTLIHPYTFSSAKCMSELLAALIAAGCVSFGIPSVSRTGIILLDIVRTGLHRVVCL